MKKTIATFGVALALTLGGIVPAAQASPVAVQSTASVVDTNIGKTYWAYQCKWRTEWWDPFNLFRTYGQKCGVVWI